MGAAAQVAIEAALPLLVIPGGTFNHFAADLGIDRMADALAALRRGTAVRIDVGLAGERLFLNTSSLGSYPAFVAIRERWRAGSASPRPRSSHCGPPFGSNDRCGWWSTGTSTTWP